VVQKRFTYRFPSATVYLKHTNGTNFIYCHFAYKLSRSDIVRVREGERERETDRRDSGSEIGRDKKANMVVWSCRAENRLESKVFPEKIRTARGQASGAILFTRCCARRYDCCSIFLFYFQAFLCYSVRCDISFILYRVVHRVYDSNIRQSDTRNDRSKSMIYVFRI